MDMISKVSKGTNMDQIYIPKNRPSLPIGSYVIIKPLEIEKKEATLFYYHVKNLEPIKIQIIKEIFMYIEEEQVIITGSFLDNGYNFRDIDVIILTEKSACGIKQLEDKLGIRLHLIPIKRKALMEGLATDPLYHTMLSRSVSKSRLIFNIKQEINYKILDLHLTKSRLFLENYAELTGIEKYKLLRNLISIQRFMDKQKIINVDREIDAYFGNNTVEKLKQNILPLEEIQKKYKTLFIQVQKKIFEGIQHGSK